MKKIIVAMLLVVLLSGCNAKKDVNDEEIPESHYTLLSEKMGGYEVYQKWFTYPEDYTKCTTEEVFLLDEDEYYIRKFIFDCSGTGLMIKVEEVYIFIDKAHESELLSTSDILLTSYGVIIDKLSNKTVITLESMEYINENSESINYVKTEFSVDGHYIYDLRVKTGANLNDTCVGYQDVVYLYTSGDGMVEVTYESCVLLGLYLDYNGHLFRIDQMIDTKDMTIEEFINEGMNFS